MRFKNWDNNTESLWYPSPDTFKLAWLWLFVTLTNLVGHPIKLIMRLPIVHNRLGWINYKNAH